MNKEAKYILSNVSSNNNKFWYITLEGTTINVHNGRVGDAGQHQRPKSFTDTEAAETFFDKKCLEKEKKGYKKLQVINSNNSTTTKKLNEKSLTSVAKSQINTGCAITSKLITYFTKVNTHTILSNTTIQYDTASGTFSTPCGIITSEAITDARTILASISTYVERKRFASSKYADLLNDYLMLVPQKTGRKLDPEKLYPDLIAVQQQNDILDSLEASITSISNTIKSPIPGNPIEEKIFDVRIEVLKDDKEKSRIIKKCKDTMQSIHASSALSPKRVFTISITGMSKDFEEGSKVGNIQELFHGTKSANCLSILKSGLVIPPTNSSHVTGRMFGNGLYFASSCSKSLNYSYGYWGGKYDKNCFMFLADVAMGKSYTPKSYTERLPKSGYDSTHAKARVSGVQNDELIVYRTDRCNLKYLIEFTG